MNLLQIARDTLHLFRITRALWGLGFCLSFATMISLLEIFTRGNSTLGCVVILADLFASVISLIAIAGLIFATHQAYLEKAPNFWEAWRQGWAKIHRVFGLLLLLVPALLLAFFIYRIFALRAPNSPILWVVLAAISVFDGAFFIFGVCAIIIDGVGPIVAAWTSLLITLKNFFTVFLVAALAFLIQILFTGLITAILATGLFGAQLPSPLSLDFASYQTLQSVPIVAMANWLLHLVLFPFIVGVLTLTYLKLTQEQVLGTHSLYL